MNSEYLLKNLFDNFSTNPKKPFYIKKAKTSTINTCCGVTAEYNGYLHMFDKFEDCKEKGNLFCKNHNKFTIELENKIEKYQIPATETWQDVDGEWMEDDLGYMETETLAEDNLLEFFAFKEEVKTTCNRHGKWCLCKKYYLKQDYKYLTIDLYPIGTTLIFSYYNMKNNLIFKGIIYDDLQLTKTIKAIKNLHVERYYQMILSMLEGYIYINKKIFNTMLINKFSNDIVKEINKSTFSEIDLTIIKNKLIIIKNNKLDIKDKILSFLDFMNNIFNNHNSILSNKRFCSSIKNAMNNNKDIILKSNNNLYIDSLNKFYILIDKAENN